MLRLGRSLTSRESTPRDLGFRALALPFLLAAVFHLVCVGAPSLAGGDPPWRHGLFVAVNTLVAAGLVRRPRWFPWAFAVLCVQQGASHGTAAVVAWQHGHRIDLASVLVLSGLPLVLACLAWDARHPPSRKALPPPTT